ncbi:rab-GTPase-TBC domain-containing protein [Geopyxis carbonaria]|nr:rab-GTPase-TBC domain-containing protein [Geopyxis carbonaria]
MNEDRPTSDDSSLDEITSSNTQSRHNAAKPSLSRAGSSRIFTDSEKKKIDVIRSACQAGNREAVVELAISADGLVSDEVRRDAWPFLLGCKDYIDSRNEDEKPPAARQWVKLPPHEDEGQVKLDVDRSFIYYPTNMSPRQLEERKRELSDLIVEVLRRHPMLGYFQGFHDVCQVILLVLGPQLAVTAVEHIALLRIRDFMLPSMSPALDHIRLLYPLLDSADSKLCAHLSRTQPFFALAATLTLYAHDIQEYSNIARLFDVFLAKDPVFPLYLFAQIVMERRDELFDIPDEEPEMLHSILSKLPKPLDLEGLIARAIKLLNERPPEKLSTWRYVSSTSVLKTSRQHSASCLKSEGSTLLEAEELFQKQCRQLARDKRRKEFFEALVKHRKPAILGLTIIVGLSSIAFSMYAQRHGLGPLPGLGISSLWRMFWQRRA